MSYNYQSTPKHNAVSSTMLRNWQDQRERTSTYQSAASKAPYNMASSPRHQDSVSSFDGKLQQSGVVSLLRSIPGRLRAWNRRRLAIAELYTLDDQLLRDIGIEPGQIEHFVDAVARARRTGDMPPVLRQIRNRRNGWMS